MNKQLPINQLVPLFQEILDSGSNVNFTTKGTSMLPMLGDGVDTVVLTKPKGKLKKYDLPLFFFKGSKSYVLHRVIKVKNDGTYVMCGDNRDICEINVTDNDIVAVVTSFSHKGKNYSVKDFRYKLYCRFLVGKKKLKWKYSSFKEKLYPYYRKFFKNE
ncbi:MAG: S24/S26 family peptidase [Ruminococcus sp.]